MAPIIQVTHLYKQYKHIRAVDDLSFTVNKGEIYGFLGQNGAGKSTAIRMLLTLVKPTSGTIELFGTDLQSNRTEILKKVGAIIERPELYKYLTASENMNLFAKMSGIRVKQGLILERLSMVGLQDRAADKVNTYSQGMKQRLGLAVALIHDPELIILDEPTNGLDPQGIADVRNLILHLSRDQGKTIFVSSHLLSEMEVLADRMLILDKGRKIVEGAVKDLLDPAKMMVKCEVLNYEQTIPLLKGTNWWPLIKEIDKGMLMFELDRNKIPELLKDLVIMKAEVMSLQPVHSLEQYFLSLTTANRHVDTFTD